jgi:beta-fructofuranosidase
MSETRGTPSSPVAGPSLPSGVDDLERASRELLRVTDERHAPQYHLRPSSGWMNDPNGVIQWRGRYHVFYQHNPVRPSWGPPHWGHAVSDDLVHWEHLPIALAPDMQPADSDGCWSGCLVDDDGTPSILYTGVNGGAQCTCLATGSADLVTWRKDAANPIARVPEGLAAHTLEAFRDPYVWRDDGDWYALVGTSVGGVGQALLYRSQDLRAWEYLHPLVPAHADEICNDSGQIWECPNLFELDGEHVLLVSRWHGTALTYPNAFVGRYEEGRFHPHRRQRLDWGYRCYYAPLSLIDDRGRRIVWAWLQEQRHAERTEASWAGVASLPRQLTLERGVLRQRFVPELEALRGERVRLDETEVGGARRLDLGGPLLELRATLARGSAAVSGLRLRHTPSEHTDVLVAWDAGRLLVDTRHAKGEHATDYAVDTAPIKADGERLEHVDLHLYLDHSVLELIVDDRHALSTRVYPSGPELDAVELVAHGGVARIERLEAWRLRSIW